MERCRKKAKTYLRLTREDIEDLTMGGNTAMHHILLQLNPEYVGLAPFPPVIHHSLDIKARDLRHQDQRLGLCPRPAQRGRVCGGGQRGRADRRGTLQKR